MPTLVFFSLMKCIDPAIEATDCLWDALTGRNIFWATMSLQTFQILRFVNIPIRDVSERWVQLLPLMFNPGPEVTVDECFLPLHGKCPFRQYMPSKPGKYGMKIWAEKNSYAWNLRIYTGKSTSGIPEKTQHHGYDLGQELLRRNPEKNSYCPKNDKM